MEREKRDRDRGRRLSDLYERLDLACSLPPEEAVRICKSIVNDSIRDAGMDPGDPTGVRSETYGLHIDAPKTASGVGSAGGAPRSENARNGRGRGRR